MRISARLEGHDRFRARLERLWTRSPQAIAQALTRTAAQGRTLLRRSVSEASGLPQKTIGGRLRFEAARPDRLESKIVVREGGQISLLKFLGMSGFRSGKGIGGRPYKLSDFQPVSGMDFLAEFKSGHRGVFARITRKRLPIELEFGPSVPDIVEHRQLLEKLNGPLSAIYRRRIEHELDRLVGDQGRG